MFELYMIAKMIAWLPPINSNFIILLQTITYLFSPEPLFWAKVLIQSNLSNCRIGGILNSLHLWRAFEWSLMQENIIGLQTPFLRMIHDTIFNRPKKLAIKVNHWLYRIQNLSWFKPASSQRVSFTAILSFIR